MSWTEALRARKEADDLSTKAEELAEKAATSAEDNTEKLEASGTFSLSSLGDAKGAQDASLDATAAVDRSGRLPMAPPLSSCASRRWKMRRHACVRKWEGVRAGSAPWG